MGKRKPVKSKLQLHLEGKSAHQPSGITPPKILLFDIETTGLRADFGNLLGCCWLWYGEKKVHTLSIVDTEAYARGEPWDDGELVKKIYELLLEADYIVFHYGDRFDLKFVKSKMIRHGLYMPKVQTVDTWMVARTNLLLQRNSMDNLADFFETSRKGKVAKKEWMMAGYGKRSSINKIMKYCKQDIVTLLGVFEILKPYCSNINYNLHYNQDGCPRCGSLNLIKQGFKYTAAGKVQKMQCTDCHGWSSDSRKTTTRIR
jgi:uncharacterized protein YprB with RNaseH-like and TPR domain